MMNKIIAVQGDHPSLLNPLNDTTIFLINEIQKAPLAPVVKPK